MSSDTKYVNSFVYKDVEEKLQNLVSVMDDLHTKNVISRRLRYTEIDIEKEKTAGRLKADEVFVPQHIIDANIRREQSSYIQFVTQSSRAVVMQDVDEPGLDMTIIERDVTNRVRFDGWQLSMFACIDGMQQNGYGALELVLDERQPGNIAHEFVQLGDLGFVGDTRNLQEAEYVSRNYFFSKTRLLSMVNEEGYNFDPAQVKLVIDKEPDSRDDTDVYNSKDKSLYRIQKLMFRVNGIVHVGWCCNKTCTDWLRAPRPLYIGRRAAVTDPMTGQQLMMPGQNLPQSQESYETLYPYYIFPYLITENNTISQLKGRAYLDQDTQTAATSLLSSFCTAHRRAASLYFSKDTDDPNADVLMQKNVYLEAGVLINKKVTQFQLTPPSSDMIGAINLIVTANQSETSKVNFAAQNRKDSRKTATEIDAAQQESQTLSTVQVVLFSNSLRGMYQTMFDIVKSRVLTGLIKVDPLLVQLYGRNYLIKPAGDTDVIDRQRIVKLMMDAWPVMQATPAAEAFLSDLLTKMFPDQAQKYIRIFMQAQQERAQQPPPKSPEQMAAEADIAKQQAELQMSQESHKADLMKRMMEGQIDMAAAKQELMQREAEFQQKMHHNELAAQQKRQLAASNK